MLAVAPLTSFRPDALGAELVRLRRDVHLSQRTLAKLAAVSNTSISNLEIGVAPPPHPTVLMKIARGLFTSGSGATDHQRAAEAYLSLMRASGYLPDAEVEDATAPRPTDDLIERIMDVLGPERRHRLADVLEQIADWPERDQDAVITVLKAAVESGVWGKRTPTDS